MKATDKSTSRRAVLTALAAAPLAGGAGALAVSVESDPIFSLLERHRNVVAALYAVDELADPARYDAAGDDLIAADKAVITTRPTTVAGCLAFIDFMIADLVKQGDDDDWTYRALKTLSEALPGLTPAA